MTEDQARDALLVRAVDTDEAARTLWSDDDREWASRAAAEVVGERAPADAFIARRAQLAVERLAGRDRQIARTLRLARWRAWPGVVLAVLAFALGIAVDAIGPAHRVNLLAPPLLAVLGWNIVVYLLIVGRGLAGAVSERARGLGPLARAVARITHAAIAPAGHAAPVLATFVRDWTHASRTLIAARAGRVLHVAAIAFALGLLAGLYFRGLVFEYRAGWESTFLDAPQVHRLLSFVLGPARALTGIAAPDVERIAALRFGAGAGENAAPWIHLFAATLLLAVVLPRLALALGDYWLERRLARRFPLRLDDPYFQRLARGWRGEAAVVHVLPYGQQPGPQAALALQALVVRALGSRTRVTIAPTIEFGAEDAFDAAAWAAALGDSAPTLAIVLFALTATPEPEHQGAFVARVAAALAPATARLALIDESTFRVRLGGDTARLDERRAAWKAMLDARQVTSLFIDLDAPDVPAAGRALADAVAGRSGGDG